MDQGEPTLDLIVLSNLAPMAASDQPFRERPHRVDKETLAALMEEAAPSLVLGTPGATGTDSVKTTLTFRSFRAFRPEQLATELPGPKAVLELKKHLQGLYEGTVAENEFLQTLQTLEAPTELIDPLKAALAGGPTPPDLADDQPPVDSPRGEPADREPKSAGDDTLDSLFQMVDVDISSPAPSAPASRALDQLVRELVQRPGTKGKLARDQLQRLMTLLDEAASETVRNTLHDPAFQDLEASWRGLRFLVGRLDFRSNVRLHVFSAPPRAMLQTVKEKLLSFIEELRSESRTVIVLLDTAFDASEEALGELQEVARLASEGEFPVLASLDPAILGVSSLDETQGMDNLSDLLEGSDKPAWTALRSREEARWISVSMNRFLLRLPYGRNSDPVKGFDFEENPEGEEPVYLWGRPAWVPAALAGASFARTGWAADITGPGESGTQEDIPLRPLRRPGGEVVQIPLEALLSEHRLLELSQAGILALGCRRNDDKVFVATAPAVRKPEQTTDTTARRIEALRSSLPYQLFAAQVTSFLEHLLRWRDPQKSLDEIAAIAAAGLEVLSAGDEGMGLKVSASVSEEESPGQPALVFRVTPKARAIKGLPDLVLVLPMQKS
jgi:type VI secretion system protein ImpC